MFGHPLPLVTQKVLEAMAKSGESLPDHHSCPALARHQAVKFPHLLFLLVGVLLASSQATSMGMCEELGLLRPVRLGPGEGALRPETHFHMWELRCLSSMELSAEQNRSSRRLNT